MEQKSQLQDLLSGRRPWLPETFHLKSYSYRNGTAIANWTQRYANGKEFNHDREQDIAMSQKIALLITGCYADFYASMKAVQVASRTDARIHVMQLSENLDDCFNSRKIMQPEELSDLIGLISWLSEIERISVSFHVINIDSEKEIVEFLRRHDITCLVAGAHDRECLGQKKKWLQNLQEQLGSDKLWFQRSFQVLVTLPWDDVPFNRALDQLGYKKRQSGR